MITFQIAGYLTEFTGGRAEIALDDSAATVGEALNQLWTQHVGLRDRVLTEQGEVRPHVNIFLNSETIRRDEALQTPLDEDAEICIMPAVSGGEVTNRLEFKLQLAWCEIDDLTLKSKPWLSGILMRRQL